MSTTVTPGAAHDAGHAHHHPDPTVPVLWGVLAEFETADQMSHATAAATKAGYTHVDAYSPYPVGEAADALNFPKSEMGPIMFIGGLTGACAGFIMQYWANTYGYSLNIAGRPYFSWPSFVPVTFEMMVLTTALSGFFGLMALCGLPRFNHPLFNSAKFDRASRDRFFVCIEATDPQFDAAKARELFNGLHPLSVEEVME
ncbi:DUF3341 domain-containing protein [Gemmata sp. JC673]|uniref:DUF3341 domain-containing protein n=1 Tax=Gemmata algarum TaxID=2975278 RepID=A0ABU5F6B0_9BACT|nr:DUF3341 domain-containing protein [Gemmata algarum]MDY3562292.1 DUF3341 domain-containing protein [Gemmata algarum]